MVTKYQTQRGEVLDAICYRIYRAGSGYVEAVLDANPGLTAPILPAGTVITLPDVALPDADEVPVVTLWD